MRNLQLVKLQNLQQVNVFSGANGSGKTSLLEGIHLLGMARSFRGNSVKSVVSHGESACTVFGELVGSSSAHEGRLPIGIHREIRGGVKIKVAGQPIKSVAELAEHLPLQVINANSFDLLTGAPASRRQYLDWGVFHVEHQFFREWQRFQRCIKQRNKLLRHGKMSEAELDVWTRDIADAGSAINDMRKNYFSQLKSGFSDILERLIPSLTAVELRYRQGWDKGLSYSEALQNSLEVDREQGYTHAGPQRADIKVTTDGYPAADTLSRGQQKLVVCALKLAQGQMMSDQGKGSCSYLVDDLPSELDREHCAKVCEQLSMMQAQVFITCVDAGSIAELWPKNDQISMFHVEHGIVSAANT